MLGVRDGSHQTRAHQLMVQGQIESPENIHKNNIIWTSVIHRSIFTYMNTHMHIITRKEGTVNLKESGKGHMGVFGRRKGKREML